MRAVLFLAVVCLAGVADAQGIYNPFGGGVQYMGPYQPSRVYPGFHYYNPTAPVYPIAAPYGRGYGGAAYWQREEAITELRRIRWELEDARWRRR